MISANVNYNIRKAVYRRDGYRCALCDSTRYLQIHHIIPRGQGGPKDNPENMITLCADCHALAHGIDLRDVEPIPLQARWNVQSPRPNAAVLSRLPSTRNTVSSRKPLSRM